MSGGRDARRENPLDGGYGPGPFSSRLIGISEQTFRPHGPRAPPRGLPALELLSRSRRTATGGWIVPLTETPLDLESSKDSRPRMLIHARESSSTSGHSDPSGLDSGPTSRVGGVALGRHGHERHARVEGTSSGLVSVG
ncbi:DUF5953 family protein [Cystobacter fuscus]|uniref:DUF5953 family protein n=1 Tax=Cystobacter fuscus TaxID=43 RepID=UPI0009715523|nr:DUF5953 family protein [Cystobacter fuscus]